MEPCLCSFFLTIYLKVAKRLKKPLKHMFLTQFTYLKIYEFNLNFNYFVLAYIYKKCGYFFYTFLQPDFIIMNIGQMTESIEKLKMVILNNLRNSTRRMENLRKFGTCATKFRCDGRSGISPITCGGGVPRCQAMGRLVSLI